MTSEILFLSSHMSWEMLAMSSNCRSESSPRYWD